MSLSRQTIRERKRQLHKEETQKQTQRQTMAELIEAERLIDQKEQSQLQNALQTGSLCIAILAQVPEKRDGCEGIAQNSIDYLSALLERQTAKLTAVPPDEPEDDDEEEEDEPILASVG